MGSNHVNTVHGLVGRQEVGHKLLVVLVHHTSVCVCVCVCVFVSVDIVLPTNSYM